MIEAAAEVYDALVAGTFYQQQEEALAWIRARQGIKITGKNMPEAKP